MTERQQTITTCDRCGKQESIDYARDNPTAWLGWWQLKGKPPYQFYGPKGLPGGDFCSVACLKEFVTEELEG